MLFTEDGGQAAGSVAQGWASTVANLGGMGLISALFYWIITKRMPAQEKEYRDDIQKMTALAAAQEQTHRNDVQQMAALFQGELQRERTAREAQQELFRTTVTSLSAGTLGTFQEILREVRQIKNGTGGRT